MTINKSKKYDTNFTAGGLLFNEFITLEEILLSNNFDELIQKEQEENKSIGITTNSARKRIISEIIRRYKNSPKNFWDNFYIWNEQEQKIALFFLVLKTYPIILDLHLEVSLKKYRLGSDLDAYDITMRFDEIASNNDKVASWSESTFNKLNTQYRKVIKDAGLYVNNKLVSPNNIDSTFWSYFEEINEAWFLETCFINN